MMKKGEEENEQFQLSQYFLLKQLALELLLMLNNIRS
jgi:hypothetical protein